jgi:hypothetical protein
MYRLVIVLALALALTSPALAKGPKAANTGLTPDLSQAGKSDSAKKPQSTEGKSAAHREDAEKRHYGLERHEMGGKAKGKGKAKTP